MPWLLLLALVATSALWAGTFFEGVHPAAVGCLHALVVVTAMLGWPRDLDPLGLGPRLRWLPALAWLTLIASASASPTPRSALSAVVLFPALLVVAGGVGRLDDRARARLLRGVVALVGLVAAWGLIARWAELSERAALPLGHHLLFGTWLVVLAPLAVAQQSERGPWRALGLTCCGLALVALWATQSVAAWIGLGVAVLVGCVGRTRLVAALLVGAGVVGVGGLRLVQALDAGDASLSARVVYWSGALDGFTARPWLGWGPGASPWQLPAWVEPVPGLNPAGEIVSDPHSLVLQTLFELGLIGFVVWLALGWLLARPVAATIESRAARAGLIGGVATLTVTPTLGTSAVWIAIAIAVGFTRWPRETPPPPSAWGALYGAVAIVVLGVVDWAHLESARAASAAQPASRVSHLERAVRLDPSMPLYRLRLGLEDEWAGDRLYQLSAAARSGGAVATSWLALGLAASEAGATELGILALEEACALDPMWAAAPWALVTRDLALGVEAEVAAHAVLADPRLIASPWWTEALARRTARVVDSWPGVDAGWRVDVALLLRQLATTPARGPRATLVYEMDADPSLALSVHAFRRAARPTDLLSVALDRRRLAEVEAIPPAFALESTEVLAVPAGCSSSRGALELRAEVRAGTSPGRTLR